MTLWGFVSTKKCSGNEREILEFGNPEIWNEILVIAHKCLDGPKATCMH